MDLIPPSQGLEMVPFHGLARLRCGVCELGVVFLGVRHSRSPVIQRSHPSLYKRRKCPGSWRSGEEEKGGIGSVDDQAGPGACISIVSAFQGSF